MKSEILLSLRGKLFSQKVYTKSKPQFFEHLLYLRRRLIIYFFRDITN